MVLFLRYHNFMKRFLLTSFFAFMISLPQAQAGEVYSCGIPDYDLVDVDDPQTHDVCDIYTRQIQYRDDYLAYKDSLLERQENFARARRAALANYQAQLDALYGYED